MPREAERAHSRTLLLTWGILLAAGMSAVNAYSNSAGEPGSPPSEWPETASIPRHPGAPSLVMFAHPKCPCTRASIQELARILARIEPRVAVHVLFFDTPEAGHEWARTDSYEQANAIPGVVVQLDVGATEARRFRVSTSGHTLLYGPDDRLLFSGGITAARGHEGDNRGASAIVELCGTRGLATDADSAPVFGCEILSRERT